MDVARAKHAAIGVRTHSGWGALIAISGDAGTPELVERRRIVITDPKVPGAKQPYHFAKDLELPEAEKYLANCAAVSGRLALTALRDMVKELGGRGFRVIGSAILLASGRPLPALPSILASHALIHTAEGEFFRSAFWEACERLEIPVTGFRERELDVQANAVFGKTATRMRTMIVNLGKTAGPPWTSDQKTAALAASMALWGNAGRLVPASL